MEKNHTQ